MTEGDLQRIVGVNVRLVREARGLSQERLAEVMDYNRTYVGGVERGERNLGLRTLERFADRLGVDWRTLLVEDENTALVLAAASGRPKRKQPKRKARPAPPIE